MEVNAASLKLKSIEVIIETEDGLKLSSLFMMPEYRDNIRTLPVAQFKPMPKSPVLWFKQMLSRYHNL